ncbi:orotate phosphoribosyltransferase [Sutcliffiella cohnii]|uniref:Orotate phosphoribosyltransferase n=1 Tax=Sutcliffiella cohnii TaxID=33932 RepID=A0A223KS20_9BACI|nr:MULTISPECIES: orotate phosphoribosyltransferase [Sutcliffiella]AST92113.1 orotate phosphoribosyltransferase [Sutcliffiella cohnii]MED4015399.1 orotate phosphoribosyltransferase [Sutcliffiella cohnii]WBL13344.1 orotate phosphoribosyltransferase [Sutcliffiella sp. NC1]
MNEKIAEHLLRIKAVFLQPNDPFTWSSGMKSPIYCDNRLTLSYPKVRSDIASELAKVIQNEFGDVNVIAGTATAGIPHAAFVSERLNLPMCYVRSKAKEHGKGKQIEGKVESGQKVVVVEDLISTGGSAINAVEALRAEGCEVVGIISIFTYDLPVGKERLEASNIKAVSICNYETLLKVAVKEGYVGEKDVEKLTKWMENPQDESWMAS